MVVVAEKWPELQKLSERVQDRFMAAKGNQRSLSELDGKWNESSEHVRLKRELRREALLRIEESARTEADFGAVVRLWDELDENRERRERYHEIRCAEVPVNRCSARNGMIFSQWLMQCDVRQLQRGEFLDFIFDCPFLMHELVTDDAFAAAIHELGDVHKLILFFLAIRQYSCQRVAITQGQSDRISARPGKPSSTKSRKSSIRS